MFEDAKATLTIVVPVEAVIGAITLVLIGFTTFLHFKIRKLEKRIDSEPETHLRSENNYVADRMPPFSINRPQVDNSTLGSIPDRFVPPKHEDTHETHAFPQPQRFRLPEPIKQEPRTEMYPNQQPQRPNNFNNQPLDYNRDNPRFPRPNPKPFGDNFVSDRENRPQQKFDTRAQQSEYDNNRKYF